MIIKISYGETTQTLCDGAERGVGKSTGPEVQPHRCEEAGEVIRRLRQAKAEAVGRDNLFSTFTFTVRREFATTADSLQFWLTHGSVVLRRDTLKFYQGSTLLATMPGAHIGVADIRYSGFACIITYSVRGGAPEVAT